MEHECTTSNNLDPNDPEAPGDYQDCVDHQDPADRQVLCSDTATTLPKSVPVLEPIGRTETKEFYQTSWVSTR